MLGMIGPKNIYKLFSVGDETGPAPAGSFVVDGEMKEKFKGEREMKSKAATVIDVEGQKRKEDEVATGSTKTNWDWAGLLPSGRSRPLRLLGSSGEISGADADGRWCRILRASQKCYFGFLHVILAILYEMILFVGLFGLSLTILNGLISSRRNKFGAEISFDNFLALLIINLFLADWFQVLVQRSFWKSKFGEDYSHILKSVPCASFVLVMIRASMFSFCVTLLQVFMESKLCKSLPLDMPDNMDSGTYARSVYSNPNLLLFYVCVVYPLTGFYWMYQDSKFYPYSSVLVDFVTSLWKIGKEIFGFARVGTTGAGNYFFVMVFEIAEFIGILVIPSYLAYMWVNTSFGVEYYTHYGWTIVSIIWFAAICIAYFLISLERRLGALWKDLLKGVQARLLVNFVIFGLFTVRSLSLYFVDSAHADVVCLPMSYPLRPGAMSFISPFVMKYTLFMAFCFYAAAKILCLTAISRQETIAMEKAEKAIAVWKAKMEANAKASSERFERYLRRVKEYKISSRVRPSMFEV